MDEVTQVQRPNAAQVFSSSEWSLWNCSLMTLDAKTTKAGSKRVRPVSKPTKHTRQGRVSLSSFCWYCVYLIWTLNFWSQQLHFWSVGSLIFYPCQETKWNASQPRNFLGTCLSSFPSFCWYAESDQRSSFDHVVINFDQYGSLIFYPCQETKWNANQPRNFLGTLKYPLLLLSRCVFFIRLVRNWIGLKKQVLLSTLFFSNPVKISGWFRL